MPDYNLSQELLEAVLPSIDTSPAAHAAPESVIGNQSTNSESRWKLLGTLVVHCVPSPHICNDESKAASLCQMCLI